MVTLETQYSGVQLGNALRDDPEEMAYALATIGESCGVTFAGEVAEFVGSDKAVVLDLLRDLLDAIEAAE